MSVCDMTFIWASYNDVHWHTLEQAECAPECSWGYRHHIGTELACKMQNWCYMWRTHDCRPMLLFELNLCCTHQKKIEDDVSEGQSGCKFTLASFICLCLFYRVTIPFRGFQFKNGRGIFWCWEMRIDIVQKSLLLNWHILYWLEWG
jgi:hypothetical protein